MTMPFDVPSEKDRLLRLTADDTEIGDIVRHAIDYLHNEKIVTSDIKKIENAGKNAVFNREIARDIARLAVNQHPHDIFSITQYGVLLIKCSDVEEAERSVDAYVRDHGPQSNPRFRQLQASIHKSNKEFDEAIQILRDLPQNKFVIDELVECYVLRGRDDDMHIAKNLLEAQRNKYELSPEGALRLAKIYAQEGLSLEAYTTLKPFLSHGILEINSFANEMRMKSDISQPSTVMNAAVQAGVRKFQQTHDSEKSVFVMMKFDDGDPGVDGPILEKVFDCIRLELDKYGLVAVRADERDYSDTHYLFDNVQIYASACNYGIAVLENLYSDEMNPNVALEFGYMLAKNKKLLLLKENSFGNIRADLLGRLWKNFDIKNMQTLKSAIQAWIGVDLGITRIKV